MDELTGEQWKNELQSLLTKIRELKETHGGNVALFSTERQLAYLVALADEKVASDKALEQITLGYLATYQLQDILPEGLAERLTQITDRIRKYLHQRKRRLKTDPR